MTSQRLNSVVVLNVQRDLTDELDIPAVTDEFVCVETVFADIFGWLDVLTWLCVTVTQIRPTAVDVRMIVAYVRFIISFVWMFHSS